MNELPIKEELRTAFFGVFAIILKPRCMVRRQDKHYTILLPESSRPSATRIIIGLHNQAEQLQPDSLELEIIPNEVYVHIPYDAIEDYKRIGDLP
ncbi:MAG: hypothetical protein AABX70_00585 [Nanoarchaeota archaeon]